MHEKQLEQAYCIADLRRLAQRRLPRVVFDFVDGGAEDELALRRNEAALQSLSFLPCPLRGAGQRDQSLELFGERLSSPVLIGPTGMAGMLWPRGEVHSARAAAAAGTAYVMSHGSTVAVEDLAREVDGRLWMQVFLYRDRQLTRNFVERAQAAGYRALVLTTDNQVLGQRERDLRNGYTIPPRLRLSDMANMAIHMRWWLRMARAPRIEFANYKQYDPAAGLISLGKRMTSLLDPGVGWQDVEWLRSLWRGPMLLKGVLHPEEARRAVAIGVDGLIVSNHGGRQLDAAPASIEALPGVVAAVAGKVPVLMDGGVRRGADVLKALALGARACLIGRPQLWGLAAAGEAGVARVLEIYRSEIDRVMALCGWASLSDIDRSALFTAERLASELPAQVAAALPLRRVGSLG